MGVRVLFALLLAMTVVDYSVAACYKGDTACFCKALGGEFRPLSPPLGPDACRVSYIHQGLQRYVHVYLPLSFDGVTQFPLWVHLHGVFWTTMGDIGKLVGHPVNGTDVIPKWDHAVELLGDKAIIVYPQALGDPGTGDEAVDGQGKTYRQFWNIPFWRCSVGICRPKDLDDMGFVEAVLADLPQRLPTTPGKLYLSGESAGGMLVNALLCESPAVASAITAAVDMLGGIGEQYAFGPKCSAAPAAPYLKLHGTDDPSITYDQRILVDGVNFLSAIEAAQQRAKHNGCSPKDAGPQTTAADGQMKCTDFCGKAAGKPTATVCGMLGVKHTTDFPHPGFVFEQAWQFFEQQAKLQSASRQAAAKPAAGAAAVTREASVVPAAQAAAPIQGPLRLNITFPGVTLSVFKASMARKALATVSAIAGLPADNITATYTNAPNNKRRRGMLAAAAGDADAGVGVLASFKLAAAKPKEVANNIVQAVQDGSLFLKLQASGLAPAWQGSRPGSSNFTPVVSLSAKNGKSPSEQLRLLQPTSLLAAGQHELQLHSHAPESAGLEGQRTTPELSGAGNSSSSRSNSTGIIVGAVVGGLAGAALLTGAAWWAVTTAKKPRLPKTIISTPSPCMDSDASSTMSSSASTGTLNQSIDVVMHVSDDAWPATKTVAA